MTFHLFCLGGLRPLLLSGHSVGPRRPLSSVDHHEEWLAFLDDIRGELRRIASADVLHRVDRVGWDHQALASGDPCRWQAVDLVLKRPFQDVDDLFTRMLVPKKWGVGADFDPVLDDLPSGNAEVVLLDVGASESGRLWSGGAHVNLLWWWRSRTLRLMGPSAGVGTRRGAR